MPSNASTILAHLIGTTPITEFSLGNLQEMNRFLDPERLFPVACDANMNEIYRVKIQFHVGSHHLSPVVNPANAVLRESQ